MALTNAERLAHYRAQTGSEVLTPAQRRRVNKVAHRALSPHAGITRASRLRKAHERNERRRLRAEGAVLMHVIRDGRVSAFLSNLRRRR